MADENIYNFTDELLGSNYFSCAVCKNILRPPIMLTENIGNICAICYEGKHEIMNWKCLNNYVLEDIIKLLKFPCKFKAKGCNERCSYEELVSHQNKCKYGSKICPMFKFPTCEWEGNNSEFVAHFKESHGDHVINFENNLFFLETSLKELDLVKLLVMNRHTYILRMETDLEKRKLFYMICSVNDEQISLSEYSVKHKGSSENYIKTRSKIQSYHNIYKEFDENIAVEVDLDALKQISRISDTITNIFKIKVDETLMDCIDEKMLPYFECPICKNFMKPPIYQCQSGHSICNMCRPRLEKCPTCRAMFGHTRNYSLEGLTSGVKYPCIYHDVGCMENASAYQITQHEKECSFKPFTCPIPTCHLTGNQQALVNHLVNYHADTVIFSGSPGYSETFRLNQDPYSNRLYEQKCVIASGHIFRISIKRVAEHCLWATEVICNNESKTFIYEVSIIDTKRPEKKLIRTDYCLDEMPDEELFKKCIIFPNSILSSYSDHGVVTYHFMIREK